MFKTAFILEFYLTPDKLQLTLFLLKVEIALNVSVIEVFIIDQVLYT